MEAELFEKVIIKFDVSNFFIDDKTFLHSEAKNGWMAIISSFF